MNNPVKKRIDPNQQRGYALLITVILLLALSMISIRFFSGSLTESKIAGYNRDAEESFQLAESALNTVYGGFIYNADFYDEDDIIDNQAVINLDEPLPLPNPYMYFVSGSGLIEQTVPSILQRVADGEARSTGGTVNGSQVSPTSTTLLLSNLFNGTAQPLIFTPSDSGLQQRDDAWSTLPANKGKAAVWIEITRDAFQENRLYLFVQSLAQVGKSKSYIQRYIGEYSDLLGTNVWALTEANPNPGN